MITEILNEKQNKKRHRINEGKRRFYVKYSSWFDSHDYDIDAISTALKSVGAKNITTKAFSPNRPEVVVFHAEPSQIEKMESALEKIGIKWPIIHNVLPGRNSN
jgi:hypothetical protein